MKIMRNIIEIDEERCNGCGQCILDCAEHALIIENGKAKVISDHLCDGLGACLQGCPQDALRIITREASPFDEEAVHALQIQHTENKQELPVAKSACQQAQLKMPVPEGVQWPIKLRLIQANAPFLQNANILLVADCAPATHKNFATLCKDKIIMLACPKFEEQEAIAKKLYEILATNNINELNTLRMEVPCCNGLEGITKRVIELYEKNANQKIPNLKNIILTRDGTIKGNQSL